MNASSALNMHHYMHVASVLMLTFTEMQHPMSVTATMHRDHSQMHCDNLHDAQTSSMAGTHQLWLFLQIFLDTPTQDNYIVIPDGSGIFVIEALEPLFIDTSGTVYLAQDLIVHVGQLVAGSIGRSFGKPSAPPLTSGGSLTAEKHTLLCFSFFLSSAAPCLHGDPLLMHGTGLAHACRPAYHTTGVTAIWVFSL